MIHCPSLSICFSLIFIGVYILSSLARSGNSCEDIDPVACSSMARENKDLCSESELSQSVCPKFCGNCPTTCYNCNITSPDVSSCNTVTCDQNKMCLLEMMRTTKTGAVTYRLGCATEHFCDTGMKRALHSRSVTIDCCDSDLCNVPVGTTLPSTKHMIITTAQTTNSTTAMTTVRSHCEANPCVHGTCSSTEHSYVCACDHGWIGSICNISDPCGNSSCYNGICFGFEDGDMHCICDSGYTGNACDIAIDSCDRNPCLHGRCSTSGTHFKCHCQHGWTGATCDSVIDQCASKLCLHGHCTSNLLSFNCSCSEGYFGTYCDKFCRRDVLVRIDQSLFDYLDDQSTVQFLQKLVNEMLIGSSGVLMEMSVFADTNVYYRWALNSYTYKSKLLSAISNLPNQHVRFTSLPDIYAPVHSLYMQAFNGHGERSNVRDAILIITGPFTNHNYNIKSESHIVNSYIPITTIGVGNVDTAVLRSISKDSSRALKVDSITDLVDGDFVNKVLNLICT